MLRSALTLRALCYGPTGAILAAAHLVAARGDRRGAQLGLPVLLAARRGDERAGAGRARLVDEAEALLRWTRRVIEGTAGHPERLHPLYTVDGYELGAEAVIETLPGYAGSRPVRVGNAANRQVQLDVFGPVADLIAALADLRGRSGRASGRSLLSDMVEAVSRRWHEPDHGIWEARIPPRHHVYSKVMGWLTVDRALRVARRHGGEDRPDWAALRDKIAQDVLERGWHDGGRGVHGGLRPPGDGRVVACGSACPACCRPTTRGSSPRCSRSRRSCAAGRSSTGTGGTTVCPGARAASTSAAPG